MTSNPATLVCDWDPDRRVILAIYQRDDVTGLPVDGVKGATGVPRDPNGRVETLPLIQDQPENAIERFPQLLGTSVAVPAEGGTAVRMTYPNADFSEAAVRAELKRMAREQARKILETTDWYVTRKAETGRDVPADVAAQRESVRLQIDAITDDIDATSGADLITYDWAFQGVDPHLQGRTR